MHVCLESSGKCAAVFILSRHGIQAWRWKPNTRWLLQSAAWGKVDSQLGRKNCDFISADTWMSPFHTEHDKDSGIHDVWFGVQCLPGSPPAGVSACFHLCNRWASLAWLGEQIGTNAPRPSALHFAKANITRTASWWLSQRQSQCFEQAPRVSVGSRMLVCTLFVCSEEAGEPFKHLDLWCSEVQELLVGGIQEASCEESGKIVKMRGNGVFWVTETLMHIHTIMPLRCFSKERTWERKASISVLQGVNNGVLSPKWLMPEKLRAGSGGKYSPVSRVRAPPPVQDLSEAEVWLSVQKLPWRLSGVRRGFLRRRAVGAGLSQKMGDYVGISPSLQLSARTSSPWGASWVCLSCGKHRQVSPASRERDGSSPWQLIQPECGEKWCSSPQCPQEDGGTTVARQNTGSPADFGFPTFNAKFGTFLC